MAMLVITRWYHENGAGVLPRLASCEAMRQQHTIQGGAP